jgi:hypothetical protein
MPSFLNKQRDDFQTKIVLPSAFETYLNYAVAKPSKGYSDLFQLPGLFVIEREQTNIKVSIEQSTLSFLCKPKTVLDALESLAEISRLSIPEEEKKAFAEAIYQPLKDYLVFNGYKSFIKHVGFNTMFWALGVAAVLVFGTVPTFLPIIGLVLLALLLGSCTGFISHCVYAWQRATSTHEKLAKVREEVSYTCLKSVVQTLPVFKQVPIRQHQGSGFQRSSSNSTPEFWASASDITPITEQEEPKNRQTFDITANQFKTYPT